ncbi:MAG: metallophosphoesterase [Armatimonadetes bacterium]|nr:metallophosphoesterase [Armatimonadota bacterium]
MTAPTFIIGDVHGQLDNFLRLLHEAGLIDSEQAWSGGGARLYLLGDYVDRGPDGLGVIDLLMRLRVEAATAGGRVEALLGNHDVMLLAAYRFGDERPPDGDLSFLDVWWRNGGRLRDLNGLTPERLLWLAQRPAMVLVGDTLLQHADSAFYADYASTIAEVNAALADILVSDDYHAWAGLIVAFVRRMEFDEANGGSLADLREYLRLYGARRLIHGHTPIGYVARDIRGPITAPWSYADGLCLNVDGGMFLGEPGFVYELPTDAPDPGEVGSYGA